MALNNEQNKALQACKDGRNVFLTGAPGVGKSFVTKSIISHFRKHLGTKELGVTASTGCAAVLIGGSTVHSFMRVGLAKREASELYRTICRKYHQRYVDLKELKVLIIDEISMIDAAFFEKISEYMSLVKNDKRPFGGVQLVLVGDFYQLPPVHGDYCFESPVWSALKLKTAELTVQVRQAGDPVFQNLLTEIREGLVTPDTMSILSNCVGNKLDKKIKYTKLYPKNIDVDRINEHFMQKVMEKYGHRSHTFKNDIKGTVGICVDCQVMITRNLDTECGIINGTRGVVESIDYHSEVVIIKLCSGSSYEVAMVELLDDDETPVCSIMPLKLAWATTIHKSQGATIDKLDIDLGGDIFAYGQAYTALSRAVSLNGLRIKAVLKRSFKTDPKVKQFYDDMKWTDAIKTPVSKAPEPPVVVAAPEPEPPTPVAAPDVNIEAEPPTPVAAPKPPFPTTVATIKAELKLYGVKCTGVKAVLVARLVALREAAAPVPFPAEA